MTKNKILALIVILTIAFYAAWQYYEANMTSCCTQDPELTQNAEQLYIIGMRYLEGVGVTQSADTAIIWFQKAARLGQGDAIVQLNFLDVEY